MNGAYLCFKVFCFGGIKFEAFGIVIFCLLDFLKITNVTACRDSPIIVQRIQISAFAASGKTFCIY